METDLNRIKKLSKQKEKENWKFRSFLKRCDIPPEKIDSIVHELYQKVSSEIDCKTCANCCKEILPTLDQKDIKRFSEGLGISAAQFKKQYLVKSKELGKFTFNQKPCPFLKDNECSQFAYSPEDCKSYPYLHKNDFVFRLINVAHNCSICPIVYNVYESLKDEIRYIIALDNSNDYD